VVPGREPGRGDDIADDRGGDHRADTEHADLGSILRSIGPNVSEANEILGSQTGSQRRQIMGDAGPRPATVGAAERHSRPYPATSGDVRGMPPKQSLARSNPARPDGQGAMCTRGDPGATPSDSTMAAAESNGVRRACPDGGVPGRPRAAAAGTSELPHASRAGVPASAGRSRPPARRPRERSYPRQPPARGATAADGSRARLLATRSRSPLPTIPHCGWHRPPPHAASALVTAAPAAPATTADCHGPRNDGYCLA
jgi:hypothetical protein